MRIIEIGALALLLTTSCGVGSVSLKDVSSPARGLARSATEAPQASSGGPCDVRLYVEQLPNHRVDGVTQGTIGAVVAERTPSGLANGVCIKRPDQPLELPASMLIATGFDGPSLGRFCNDDEKGGVDHEPLAMQVGGKSVWVKYCTWNGIFHSARPFTFTLTTGTDHTVGDFVDYLRVYRNGDLMAAWNRASDQPDQRRISIKGESLVSGVFAVTHPPHLSALDIRVIPRDKATVAVETATRDDRALFEAEMKTAFGAAADAALPPGSPERKSFDCLTNWFKADAQQLRHVVSGQVPVFNPACAVLTGDAPPGQTPSPTPLSDAYAKAENQVRDQVADLRAKAYSTVDTLKAQFNERVPVELRKFIQEFITEAGKRVGPAVTTAVTTCGNELVDHDLKADCEKALMAVDPALGKRYSALVRAVKALNADVVTVLRTADETYALADRLSEKAKGIASDPTQQAQIFNAFAQSISTSGDPFEPRKDNPPLLAGEQKIDLSYSDHWQTFMFAPWNGVPIHVTHDADADFSAAVLIPFLDVAGVRYQWGKGRFADGRLSAGVGYVQTDRADGTKQTGALPNASLGFGNLKVGVGYVTGHGVGDGRDRVRLIFGADLYKIISGSNVEAL